MDRDVVTSNRRWIGTTTEAVVVSDSRAIDHALVWLFMGIQVQIPTRPSADRHTNTDVWLIDGEASVFPSCSAIPENRSALRESAPMSYRLVESAKIVFPEVFGHTLIYPRKKYIWFYLIDKQWNSRNRDRVDIWLNLFMLASERYFLNVKINVLISHRSKFNQLHVPFNLINVIKDLANFIFK